MEEAMQAIIWPLDVCEDCHLPRLDVEWQPDPFMEEIHGDSTLHLLCDECAYNSAMEI
jgi:hypothetical protein